MPRRIGPAKVRQYAVADALEIHPFMLSRVSAIAMLRVSVTPWLVAATLTGF